MATGIVGGLAFSYIIFKAFLKINILNKIDSSLVWPGLIFIQYFIGSLFSGTVYNSYELWHSLGLLLAVNIRITKNKIIKKYD